MEQIMNKRRIVKSLRNIANELDNSGLYKEASTITKVMIKVADEYNINSDSKTLTNQPEESNNYKQNEPTPFIRIEVYTKEVRGSEFLNQSFTQTNGFSIGREADIRTPETIRTVSRQHCFITLNRFTKWAVYDLESKAGTLLNGKKLSPRVGQELKINDVIKLDPYVAIVITDMYPSNEEDF